jgi:cytochrome c oxidase cbb3-type subunit III
MSLGRRRSAVAVVAAVGLSALVVPTLVATGSASPIQAPAPAAPPAASAGEVSEGARLFVAYNCGDCHGAGGSGAMGPSLQDNRWRFGGSPEEVYRSIADGLPEGMPAWGPLIPRDQLLTLVDYVRSLGEGKDLTTENFTGATVERSGR